MIYKYPLEQYTQLYLSLEVSFLDIQLQGSTPTLWVNTNPNAKQHLFIIHAVMTGESPPPNTIYLRTLQVDGYVLHFYYALPS